MQEKHRPNAFDFKEQDMIFTPAPVALPHADKVSFKVLQAEWKFVKEVLAKVGNGCTISDIPTVRIISNEQDSLTDEEEQDCNDENIPQFS